MALCKLSLTNYGCNISSMNSLKQIHSLALMVLQYGKTDKEYQNETIPKLKKTELSHVDLREIKDLRTQS